MRGTSESTNLNTHILVFGLIPWQTSSLTSSAVKHFFISRQELSESRLPIRAHNAHATWPIIALFHERSTTAAPFPDFLCIHIKDGGLGEGMRWKGE